MVVTSVLLSGCPAERGRQAAMTVELEVFSGRPNPAWKLSAEESRAVVEMLKDLPAVQAVRADSGLGYRGFVLSNPEHMAALPAQIRVYDGMIVMDEEGGPRSYQDTHGVESTLLRQASQRGYGKILKDLLPPGDQRP